VLFLALCLIGIRSWRHVLRSGSVSPASPQPVALSDGSAR
jgi:hypothetical protein